MKTFFFFLFALMVGIELQAYDFEKNGVCYKISGEEAIVTYNDVKEYNIDNILDKLIVNIPKSVKYKNKKYLVTEIGENAFAAELRLTKITISNSVTFINRMAFFGCGNLSSINIPNSVTIIAGSAFEDCQNLTSIRIPDNVAVIEAKTFSGCDHLRSLTIPKGIVRIGEKAFNKCTALKKIHCNALETPLVETDAFKGTNVNDITLYVPVDVVDKYKSHPVWGQFNICIGK